MHPPRPIPAVVKRADPTQQPIIVQNISPPHVSTWEDYLRDAGIVVGLLVSGYSLFKQYRRKYNATVYTNLTAISNHGLEFDAVVTNNGNIPFVIKRASYGPMQVLPAKREKPMFWRTAAPAKYIPDSMLQVVPHGAFQVIEKDKYARIPLAMELLARMDSMRLDDDLGNSLYFDVPWAEAAAHMFILALDGWMPSYNNEKAVVFNPKTLTMYINGWGFGVRVYLPDMMKSGGCAVGPVETVQVKAFEKAVNTNQHVSPILKVERTSISGTNSKLVLKLAGFLNTADFCKQMIEKRTRHRTGLHFRFDTTTLELKDWAG